MHDWSILYLPNAIQDEIKSHGLNVESIEGRHLAISILDRDAISIDVHDVFDFIENSSDLLKCLNTIADNFENGTEDREYAVVKFIHPEVYTTNYLVIDKEYPIRLYSNANNFTIENLDTTKAFCITYDNGYEDLEYLDLSEWQNTKVLVQELKNLLD